jgi:ribose 1,5-bisphosphokinase
MSAGRAALADEEAATEAPATYAGCLVAVAGPSGAGKDSLIVGLSRRLDGDGRFVFARRVITRQGDEHEDHDSVSEAEFARLEAAGGFLLSWSANGLSYGLPASLADDLRRGATVVANVSRAVLPEVTRRFARRCIVHVTAAPEVLAERLARRGREDAERQQARLARAAGQSLPVAADVTIDNSAALEQALDSLEGAVQRLAAPAGGGSVDA